VGTTALRALESGPNKKKTSIFIYPPYKFKMVDSLITNFHLPKSSLLMLVAALMGEKWREVYLRAIDQKYRFFSFGDAMWIR
jgi:S-adenosylmethionine:tRNA ribosyltransferase-isomerase